MNMYLIFSLAIYFLVNYHSVTGHGPSLILKYSFLDETQYRSFPKLI